MSTMRNNSKKYLALTHGKCVIVCLALLLGAGNNFPKTLNNYTICINKTYVVDVQLVVNLNKNKNIHYSLMIIL